LIEELRKRRSGIPIVTVSPSGYDRCSGEDHHVSGYDPRTLLGLLQQVCASAPQIPKMDEVIAEQEEF
jgi:hypothetical protein